MAKKAAANKVMDNDNNVPNDVSTKLRKLIISNFGCIGSTPVEIDLDDIVVLVGKNNAGKSTVLRAYDVLFSSSKPKLTIDDFPNGKVDDNALPTIELHTMADANPPGNRWIGVIDGENIVRERWMWSSANAEAKRQGWDVLVNDWSDNMPWGAANVANARRPKPHRIEAFASPEKQTKQVVDLLLTTLTDSIKKLQETTVDEDGNEVPTELGQLLNAFGLVQKAIVEQAQVEIEHAQEFMTALIGNVFRGYSVKFEAQPEDDLIKGLNFFKSGAMLRMGPEDGHQSSVEKQGSGARRTLMWAALKYAAERKGKEEDSQRPNLLLLDEPELCLHPNAIREACNVLYDLPKAGNWQVMVTTHSPAFIDLSRDNTTVVRVEKDAAGEIIRGTTVFRPAAAKLSPDEREELKMLNLCDPSLCEFFFGGRTIIVEGDTEYTAFKYIINEYRNDDKLKDVHVVRARGKATICLVAKILNQFTSRYSVLHDSDCPKIFRRVRGKKEPKEVANSAWTSNVSIRDSVKEGIDDKRIRLLALVPHFEGMYFAEELKNEKPHNAWNKLRNDGALREKVRELLYCLAHHADPVPAEGFEWSDIDALEARWTEYDTK